MKITKAIGSLFILFAIVAGVAALSTTPSVYADHATAEVSIPSGTSTPGCEETDECWTPSTVTIDEGGQVTWSNDDTAAHTVTSGTATDGPDGMFDSSLFMAGNTFSVTLDEAGDYPYFCMVHPWMTGMVIVEAAGPADAMAEEIMVEIEAGAAGANEMMTIDVTFTDMEGMGVEHANYNIMATQGGKVVLDESDVHDHDGTMSHTTMALPMAASDANPVDIEVTFLGFGIDKPFTGPIGQVAQKQVVPEFGTITMMILAVAIVSIIVLTAKSRVIPRL